MKEKDFENLKIGESFNLGNNILKVMGKRIGKEACTGCFLKDKTSNCARFQKFHILPECNGYERKDGREVIFVEVKSE